MSIIRITAKVPKAAFIFLHGIGDTGEGWSWLPTVLEQSKIVNPEDINFVFPSAPSIPITGNGGNVMPGWFDIFEFNNSKAKQDVEGFFKSLDFVKGLINEQHEQFKIPFDKIIVGGFSQGGSLALAVSAISDVKLGGIIGLSAFVPVKEEIRKRHNNINFSTPVYQGHGTSDTLVSFKYGKETSEFYRGLGFVDWVFRAFPGMIHTANDEELLEVTKFIQKIIQESL